MATATARKQIDWQFPAENETITLSDFREMVLNAERAPHITLEEFYKVTDEWLN